MAYKYPSQAALALANICDQPEFMPTAEADQNPITVNWHKKRNVAGDDDE